MSGAEPYPLTFRPILKEKVWGGRRLCAFGKELPEGALVGESWEVADLGETSRTGAGGGEARSVIAGGPLAGRTLQEAIAEWGEGLLGRARLTPEGGFPMLVKFLDAGEHLSVQVHPSPEYAGRHPGAHLKTECWYVVDASPGSVIYKGVKRGVGRAALLEAIQAGRVPEVLESVEAVVGDCHTLPSGTVHALGAGVLVAEVQTPSDTTFRLYDWTREYGRAARALHTEEAIECACFEPPPPARARSAEADGPVRLARTESFTIDELRSGERIEDSGEGPVVAMALSGSGSLVSERGAFERVGLAPGVTVLVPAACARGLAVEGTGQARVLIAGLCVPGRS